MPLFLNEAPHAGDGLLPFKQRACQGGQGFQVGVPEPVDVLVQHPGVDPALLPGLVLPVHEPAQLVHLGVERLECRIAGEESAEPFALPCAEPGRPFAHGRQGSPVAFEPGSDRTGQGHEVVVDEPDDMKAVGHDAGIGKIAADDVPVGT